MASGVALDAGKSGSKQKREVDALMEENERRKRHRRDDGDDEEDRRLEHWIRKGIVVKVLNKKVADGKYYKQKGEIVGVKDKFAATVEMLESGDVLQLDQDDLETVIPKVGRQVRIVNGIGRGQLGSLLSINVEKFHASVEILTGRKRYVTSP
ncbi:hypothetical protein PINS_up002074 [Pythium insidiosum]|nr:hypothetical protein PINS_up002074 [Pythium insidiosum]